MDWYLDGPRGQVPGPPLHVPCISHCPISACFGVLPPLALASGTCSSACTHPPRKIALPLAPLPTPHRPLAHRPLSTKQPNALRSLVLRSSARLPRCQCRSLLFFDPSLFVQLGHSSLLLSNLILLFDFSSFRLFFFSFRHPFDAVNPFFPLLDDSLRQLFSKATTKAGGIFGRHQGLANIPKRTAASVFSVYPSLAPRQSLTSLSTPSLIVISDQANHDAAS